MRPEGGASTEGDGVHGHDSIVEEVGLHHTASFHGRAVAECHQVRLR